MEKIPLNKAVLPGDHHPFKTKIFGILIITFLVAKIIIDITFPESSTRASDLTTANITLAINQQRALRNLVQLNTNSLLVEAAQYKSDDMQSRHYFAHVDPDGHYIWDKIVALGYTPYLQLGENLAINFYDTDSLVNAWMNSPEHRANILNVGFRDQGMGLTLGDVSQNQYYSAIANTFGARTAQAKTPVPSPAPVAPPQVKATATPPKSSPASAPEATPPAPTPTAKAQAPTPTPIPRPSPVSPPEKQLPVAINSPSSGFSLPQKAPPAKEVVPSTTPPAILSPAGSPNLSASASALIGNNDQNAISDSQANRSLILAAGIALLLLMLVDIKKALEKKLGALDKKTNNLVLLIITLLVVAFMYWF
ncbi:MAG: CAP domain-containing protein [Candidatus Doudnabacteria bacterium]|nr:CAP domain-containing protein [Candidatus Doudnabacteria bacterium]